MTWVYAGHTTPSADETPSTGTVWNEILRTYLVTRTGWTITVDPNDSARTFCDYTFTNGVTGQPHTWYQCQSGSVFGERRYYDVTPGDNGSTEGPYTSLYSVKTGEVHRIWYSDENSRDFMVTHGKQIVFWTCSQATHLAWSGPDGPGWAPGVRRSSAWMAPSSVYAAECAGGPVWLESTTNNTTHYRVKPAIGYQPTHFSSGDQVLFSSFTLMATSDYADPISMSGKSWPLCTVNQPDVLLHVTCNNSGDYDPCTGMPHSNTAGLLVQYDGKYWIRANPNTQDISFMFDFGVNEPNFSVAPD